MPKDFSMIRGEGDSLSSLRESFLLPEGVIYLNGNSLVTFC